METIALVNENEAACSHIKLYDQGYLPSHINGGFCTWGIIFGLLSYFDKNHIFQCKKHSLLQKKFGKETDLAYA